MKSKDLEGPFLVEELPATCYIYIYIYLYMEREMYVYICTNIYIHTNKMFVNVIPGY